MARCRSSRDSLMWSARRNNCGGLVAIAMDGMWRDGGGGCYVQVDLAGSGKGRRKAEGTTLAKRWVQATNNYLPRTSRTDDGCKWSLSTGQGCCGGGPLTTEPRAGDGCTLGSDRFRRAPGHCTAIYVSLLRNPRSTQTPACSLPLREACLHSSGPLLLYNSPSPALDSCPDCAERRPAPPPPIDHPDRCLIAPLAYNRASALLANAGDLGRTGV